MPEAIRVEVVHAEPRRAISKFYRLIAPATVGEALRLAAADPDFAALALDFAAVGVFGRPVHSEHILADGDRIEIYRGPALDPKVTRRARARQERARRR